MEINQRSTTTEYNRYPEIFREIKQIVPHPSQILSFGCSTGLECETLQELYYPGIDIIGLDINQNIITENTKKNKYNNIQYYSNIEDIANKSDIIFANSVLCRWPESDGNYTFDTFESTLNIIDKLLNENGYLCIYNSKYLFSETTFFTSGRYEQINTLYKDTGFVTKYYKNNNRINNSYPYYLFRKINM